MKNLLISGSPRGKDSKTNVLVEYMAGVAKEQGMDVATWLLGERPLPQAEPHFHRDPHDSANPEPVSEFASAIEAADVVVLATPVYHGSYTALLKNALDCMTSDVFKGKTVVLATQSGSPTAGITLAHLQDIVRTTQGTVHNSLLVVSSSDIDLDKREVTGQISNRIEQILSDIG